LLTFARNVARPHLFLPKVAKNAIPAAIQCAKLINCRVD